MVADRGASSRAGGGARAERRGRPSVCGRGCVAGPDGRAPARSAARVRQVDRRARPLPTLGDGGGLGTPFQRVERGPRLRTRPHRQHDMQGPRGCDGRKGGTRAQGIGRSRGGLTTRIHAAVDAPGPPVRLIPTAGQRGDGPQAAALIDGLDGVGHVIADAACDSGALRGRSGTNFGRKPPSRPTRPARSSRPSPPISTQNATRSGTSSSGSSASVASRCAALRCEKTLTSFRGFVFLISALDWPR